MYVVLVSLHLFRQHPPSPPRAPSSALAHRVQATLNGADDNVSRGEVRVDGPGTEELGLATDRVIIGVDIKESCLFKQSTSVILSDGGNVDDAEAGAIVGLVGEAVDDVLVVVDGLDRRLVDSTEDGPGEVLDVDDVGGGVLVSSRASHLLLIELVIEEQVLVVIAQQPTLVGVGSTVVGGTRDLARHGATANVDNGEGILVVVEAELMALVRGHGTLVDDALSIVDVAIGGDAASILRTARVGDVHHPETATALEAQLGADSGDKSGLLVGDDVVAGAETSEVGGEVAGDGVGGRVGRISRSELGEIEDLETVAGSLGANVGKVANDLDVTPDGRNSLGRKAANVGQATIGVDLSKGSAVSLSEKGKLATTVGVRPAPDVVALTGTAAHVLVTQEALEVKAVARVLAGLAVDTGGGGGGLVAVDVEVAVGDLLLAEIALAAADDRHGHGVGGIGGAEVVLVELSSVDLLGHRGGCQGGDEDGSEAGLHLD